MDLHAPISPDCASQGGLVSKSSKLQHLAWDSARAANIHEPRYNSLYDSALKYIDNQIQIFIDQLKQRGVWENSVLIVTGDHGEALFDRGFYGHPRHNLHTEALHVPLLVKTPTGQNERIETEFSLAWLHELISEVLGIERGYFPASSGGLWVGDVDPNPPLVVSDSLDKETHTVAIRDSNKVAIISSIPKNDGPDFSYFRSAVSFNYRSDKAERCSKQLKNSELVDRARNMLTDETTLMNVEGGFSADIESHLEDLGYKM